jgi:hypothetical protein
MCDTAEPYGSVRSGAIGTNRTNRAGLMMSVDWGKAEVGVGQLDFRV